MAKIRVYELARDLNMQNKALLDKLSEMGIRVRSHMSSLDNDTIKKIKSNLLGRKSDDVIVKRVKPTVIRRRRKEVKPEPIHVETIPEPETSAEPEIEIPMDVEQAPVQDIQAPETVEVPIHPPEEEMVTGKTAEVPSEKPVLEPEKTSEVEAVEIKAEVSDISEPVVEPAEGPAEPEKPMVVTPLPRQPRAKRGAGSEPAKIIKPAPAAAPPAPEPEVKKAKTPEKERPKRGPKIKAEVVKPPTPEVPGEKKKWKKKAEAAPTEDRKFLKKKISFRRKEIVEGAALYAADHPPKKGRKGGAKGKQLPTAGEKPMITTPKAIKRRIKIDDTIVLSELAKRMGIKAGEMIKKLMGLGVMATVNQTIDFETATLVASEFDYEAEKAAFEEESIIHYEQDDPNMLIERPPVVTIMGHVDHGKTSLLDVIRKTRITDDEAGGITQHIGAYYVSTGKGQVAFLDTPGHEAFTAMRARGAEVTDLVVLVVAADDGVMPQTIEAINHSKASGVPIIVAINKIDKANAEPERVQRELAEVGLIPEDWGGDTIFVTVSAKQNQGIDELLEMILLQAELMELKANPDKMARGHVIEAQLDSGRGAVATVLVQEGTLHVGDPVVCGVHHGKIRAMRNDRGTQVTSAGPSIPVEIIGISGVPLAGDEFMALTDEKDAKQVSAYRIQKQRAQDLAKTSRMSLEKLYEQMQKGEVKDLNLIIKADVHGSIEALRDSLTKLSNEEVNIHIVHSGTGTITESDISLAAVSDAIIIGFNVRPSAKVQALAHDEHVDIRYYNIIYNAIQDVKDAIVGMMASTFKEQLLGRAEVRQVFHVPKIGAIAGSYVTEGKIERGRMARLVRDGIVCFDGKIGSLRRFKDDVKEVQTGFECGIGIENFNDVKQNDIIECYFMEEIKPELN